MVHLHEIVYARPEIKYDGPGILAHLTPDLFRIHGFHEEMLHGWHVDLNIAKRLYLIYGSCRRGYRPLVWLSLRSYAPDHPGAPPQCDPERFTNVLRGGDAPEIPEQEYNWGLADEVIEEISLRKSENEPRVRPCRRQSPYQWWRRPKSITSRSPSTASRMMRGMSCPSSSTSCLTIHVTSMWAGTAAPGVAQDVRSGTACYRLCWRDPP